MAAPPVGNLSNIGDVVNVPFTGPFTLTIIGQYSGGRIFFEASPDGGTTWVPILGTPLDAIRPPESSRVLVSGGFAQWVFNVPIPAFTNFRVRVDGVALNGVANVFVAPDTSAGFKLPRIQSGGTVPTVAAALRGGVPWSGPVAPFIGPTIPLTALPRALPTAIPQSFLA